VKERILAIDPSKPGNHTGWAQFTGGLLVACGLHELVCADPSKVAGADIVVIELPQIYPGVRNEDPNDLISVARAVGQWEQEAARQGAQTCLVRPREWKGQTPKAIHGQRTRERLSSLEAVLVPPGTRHDVIDAIGLGLWYLGRLQGTVAPSACAYIQVRRAAT
jgi:hypothetical protein